MTTVKAKATKGVYATTKEGCNGAWRVTLFFAPSATYDLARWDWANFTDEADADSYSAFWMSLQTASRAESGKRGM